MNQPSDPEVTLIGTVTKGPDVESHVRIVRKEEHRFIEIRDFVVSSQKYGRGNQFPIEAALDIAVLMERAYAACFQVVQYSDEQLAELTNRLTEATS